ncbi:MAG TPA: PDZ domain-containing protein [Candidatus Polarisedimenticolia bacterium]|jgi:S1-C subfamily serine protease
MTTFRLFPALLAALIVAALPGPAAAGEKPSEKPAEKTYKCPHPTQECLDLMVAKLRNKGWLGIEYDMDATSGGLLVRRVVAGSPAEKSGLLVGDLVTALNGVRFADKNEEALKKVSEEMKPGNTVTYTVSRAGAESVVKVTLAQMPKDVMAQFIGQHMLEHAKPPAAGE